MIDVARDLFLPLGQAGAEAFDDGSFAVDEDDDDTIDEDRVLCLIVKDGWYVGYVLDDGRVIHSDPRGVDPEEAAEDYLMLLRDYGEA